MSFTKTPAAGSYIAVKIGTVYTNIPGVEGIPEFGPEAAEYENTAINDTARTYNKDLPDPGDVTIGGSWDSKDTAHAYMLGCATNGHTNEDFKITFKSTATAQFNGNIMRFRTSAAKGQDEKFSCRVKLTGPVTYVAAT